MPLAILLSLSLSAGAHDSSLPSPAFHLSFNKGVDADKAAGNPKGKFKLEGATPRFGKGLRGQALLTEKCGEAAYYEAKGNIPADEWTMTLWVKGLAAADWHARGVDHTELVEIFGKGGWTRYYKYLHYEAIFLLTEHRRGKRSHHRLWTPKHEVPVWHMHAFLWKRGSGTQLFLDGRKAAEDGAHEVVDEPTFFRVGQSFGSNDQPRLIDELKVYPRALGASTMHRLWLTEGQFHTPQRLRVRQTAREIRIDGSVGKDEWADASVTTGLIGEADLLVADPQTRVLVTYDSSTLYVAFHSPIPEEAKRLPELRLLKGFLKSSCEQRDGTMDEDDYVGVELAPEGAGRERFVLLANGTNTRSDSRVRADGTTERGWNPDWQVKSIVSMDGWYVEMAIPLSAITDKPIRVWRVNFLRQWRQLKQGRDVWCWGKRERGTGSVAPLGDLGQLELGGPAGVCVRVDGLGAVREGRLQLNAQLVAAARAAPVVARVTIAGKTVSSKSFATEPGKVRRWQPSLDLSQVEAAEAVVSVASADGKVTHYQQHVPFHVPRSLRILCQHFPTRQLLRVRWQLRGVQASAQDLAASVEVADCETRRVAATKSVSEIGLDGEVEVDVKALPPGRYAVDARILAGDDVLANRAVELGIKPPPKWLGNTIGISDEVPPPWTPVVLRDDVVAVWGREMRYDGALLPKQITTRGQPILARPMSLTGPAGEARAQWGKVRPTEVKCVREAKMGGLSVTADVRTEFDGFTWVALSIAPTRDRANIDSLTLVVPIRKEWAKLINPYDYSMRLTGALPPDGFAGRMRPIWLGNHEGGIQFVAETDATWRVKHVEQEMQVVRKGDAVELRLAFVDHPIELREALRIEFGFIATPVKPPPPRYRHWRVFNPRGRWKGNLIEQAGPYRPYTEAAARSRPDIDIMALWSTGWGAAHARSGEVYYPIPRKRMVGRSMKRQLSTGFAAWFFPYYQLHNFWAESPEFKQYGDEWISNVDAPYIPKVGVQPTDQTMTVCQNAKSFRDFVLFGLSQAVDQMNARGFYFDVSKPISCNNRYHGCGRLCEGKPAQSTLNILGTRQLLRRIYTMVKQKRQDGLIFFHMSGQVVMPIYSFCDAMVDGENFTARLDRKENRGYERVLPLDAFAAEYSAQNSLGPASIFLPEFERAGSIRRDEWEALGSQPADYILGLVLLHDSQLWWAYLYQQQLMKFYAALDTVDWGDRYDFIPYWAQQIAKLPDGVVASFYRDTKAKRALAVVMDLGEEVVEIDTNVDLGALGVRPGAGVRDLVHGEAAQLSNGRLSLAVPRKTFRLLLVE